MNANDRIIWMNCYYAALTGLCVNWGAARQIVLLM